MPSGLKHLGASVSGLTPASGAITPAAESAASSGTTAASPTPDAVTLDQAAHVATGAKPAATILPDGTTVTTQSWRDIACELLTWLGNNKTLPTLPFQGGHRGNRYFLNTAASHKSEPMHDGYRGLELGGQHVYVDLHRSAIDILGRLVDVCRFVGVDPALVKIQLRS